MKNKFFVKSLGCKTNHIEGQLIAQELIKAGYTPANSPEDCDYFIVNTCSVTSHADNQTIYIIKQFRLKKPDSKVILTGCLAQTAANPNDLDADIVLGNDEKLDIAKFLKHSNNGIQSIFADDIFNVKKFHHKTLELLGTTRPSIKIQEGCSNRCSYCIIPYARGNPRSDSMDNIIKQINMYADKGYKEVVLVGIHIGEWGRELNKTLFDLLQEVEKTSILRYRLGSLYVTELPDEMLKFLSVSEKFCPHFHLSLQSLCNKTLKNMNRFYTKEYAINVINKINEKFLSPFIGCDIITGFPNETEEDFIETYEALKTLKLSYIHSFPYSKRKGTPACNMPNQVYEHIKKQRTKQLILLSEGLHKEFLNANRNCTHEVLFQKKDKRTGKYLGITRNYIKVYKNSEADLWNTIEMLNLSEYEIC